MRAWLTRAEELPPADPVAAEWASGARLGGPPVRLEPLLCATGSRLLAAYGHRVWMRSSPWFREWQMWASTHAA